MGSYEGHRGRQSNDNGIFDSGFDTTEIVSGHANGVDKLGERWAEENNVRVRVFPADWRIGKGAGVVRNVQMGKYADALIAVWDGKSRGTKHIIDFMRLEGKPFYVRPVKSDAPNLTWTDEDLKKNWDQK